MPQIKLLGWLVNDRLNLDSNINLMVGVIHAILNNLKPVESYLKTETRAKLCSVYMISRISYGIPQYLGETVANKYRIHSTIMKLARWSKQSYCFKVSIHDICHSLNWDTPRQLLLKSSAKLIMNIIEEQKPTQITDLIRFPRTRTMAKITTQYNPKTDIYRRSTIHQLTHLMNQIPDEIKSKTKKERAATLRRKAVALSYTDDQT